MTRVASDTQMIMMDEKATTSAPEGQNGGQIATTEGEILSQYLFIQLCLTPWLLVIAHVGLRIC